MVERGMIGGTCINVACIPTKTIINSGRVLKDARRATEFGVTGVETQVWTSTCCATAKRMSWAPW